MQNGDELNSYVKATEELVNNFNQIKTKNKKLKHEITCSIDNKKLRFEEKRKRNKEHFNFFRNK